MEFLFGLLFNMPLLVIFLVVFYLVIKILAGNIKAVAKSSHYTVSSDGHLVDPSQDLTCEKEYGHNHHTDSSSRYIVHQEAEDGYVVLNGVKRKISECKNL